MITRTLPYFGVCLHEITLILEYEIFDDASTALVSSEANPATELK